MYTASMDRSSDLSGIAAMLAATAVFVVGDSFMKLVTADLPPFETLFLRSIAASIACAVLVTLRGEGGVAHHFRRLQWPRAAAGGRGDELHPLLCRGSCSYADC